METGGTQLNNMITRDPSIRIHVCVHYNDNPSIRIHNDNMITRDPCLGRSIRATVSQVLLYFNTIIILLYYYTIVPYTILNYTILCYTILCYTILYYTILY